MTVFRNDLKHAFRVYARTPVSSLIAVVVLAISIAFVSAFLSLYVDLVVRPHPGFEDSGELVTIGENDGSDFGPIPAGLIDRIDREATSVDVVAGYMRMTQRVGPGQDSVPIEVVTRRFFSEIRPRVMLGRGFDERDHAPGAAPVAVVSAAYWRQALDADPDVIGTTVAITGRVASFLAAATDDRTTQFRVVGVMATTLPSLLADDTALWLPYESAVPLYLGRLEEFGSARQFRAIGRLARGASAAAVAAELNRRFADAVASALSPGYRLDATPGLVRDINVRRETVRQLALFLTGSVLIALVAAANVSLFLLARAPGRRRELGIRMAVGATVERLARQLVTEAGLLVVLAAMIGLVLSVWLGAYLQTMAFLRQASWQNVTPLDWRVLVLVVGFVMLLAMLVSLAPVAGLRRVGIAQSSRQLTSRPNPAQRLASTAQIAIAGAVGAAAVAFGWHLVLLMTGSPGYETDGIRVVTPGTGPDAGGQGIGFDYDALHIERERRRQAIVSLAGVDAVAFGSGLPGFEDRVISVQILSPQSERVQLEVVSADTRYFGMLGLEFLSGGPWEDGRSDVLIVNAPAAERLWGVADATGEFMPGTNTESGRSVVAGVLVGIPLGHPASVVRPRAYGPIFFYSAYEHILVKTRLSPAELRSGLQSLIDDGQLEMTIESVRDLEAVAAELIAPDSARGWLTVTAAVIVLFVAAFGFYGTQHFLVSAGRREYAIRAAQGAGPEALGRLVLRRSLGLALPGLVLAGLSGLIVVAWLRDGFVARVVSPPVVAAVVVAGLAVILLGASLGPARLVRRTQPAPLLRQD